MAQFLITIDVEDWFHVENLRPWVPPAVWNRLELRIETNVNKLLDLLDSCRLPSLEGSQPLVHGDAKLLLGAPSDDSSKNLNIHQRFPYGFKAPTLKLVRRTAPFISATFFVLGWVARRLPHLVREIASRGHEVASHGSMHRMSGALSDAELREDLASSKRLLEDITGAEVAGFRAPSFSVDDRVLGAVREAGYRYDSSYNSFGLHGRYGRITLNGQPRAGIAYQISGKFFELPVSNISVELPRLKPQALSRAKQTASAGFVLPWSGGAYFRLLPHAVFQRGVRYLLNRDGAFLFYVHPWEIDPGQPRLRQASAFARFKHYTYLEKTEDKLKKLLWRFDDCHFITCNGYLEELGLQGVVVE